jgi:NAD(P)-dependent dehydrogenase (short-subunit alcohol dehydrogenase family)
MGPQLVGRRIIVTGATRGIGRTVAIHLAARGAHVVGVGRDAEGGRTLAETAVDGPGSLGFVSADLSDVRDAAGVVERSLETLGGLDAVVNNAASHGTLQPLLGLPLDEWQAVITTNLTATFLVSQAAAPAIAREGAGSIVNVLAIQSRLPARGYGAYAASKGGLEAFTRVLAVELADLRIRVNGLVLGAVYSDSTRAALPDLATSDDLEAIPPALDQGAPTLLGRMGRPSDVAKVVAFLVSDESSFLTGSMIVADGGRTLSRAPDPLIPKVDRP